MRLKGRQARFLLTVIGGWVCLRVVMLWPVADVPGRQIAGVVPLPQGRAVPIYPMTGATLDESKIAATQAIRHPGLDPGSRATPPEVRDPDVQPAPRDGSRITSGMTVGSGGIAAAASTQPRVASLAPQPPTARIEAEAYLFVRPGSGRALAAGSALGGSQAALRIAVPLNAHFAAATRLYAPLASKGAEAALGIDWHPLAGRPLRVSIERRQRLDQAGRSAWSAYAAGGFYTALPHDLRLDGYAQAGIVGVHARDLFADGALRLEKPIAHGLSLGAGAWGAAQPGAERLDVGPRAAIRLPVTDHTISLSLEGRFRVAGNAHPGSGLALTLAADL